MTSRSIESLRQIIHNQQNIRIISIVGQKNQGLHTLKQILQKSSGITIYNQSGQTCNTERIQQEQQKLMIQASKIGTMFYHQSISQEGNQTSNKKIEKQYVIHSIGVQQNMLSVEHALRISDGVLIVVDISQQKFIQTQQLLKKAIQQKIKPVIFINKIDQYIMNQVNPQHIYQRLQHIINQINSMIKDYQSKDIQQIYFDPTKGNVVFGSAKNQWAFTVNSFVKTYSEKFKVKQYQMVQKLWGEHYYDKQNKIWTSSNVNKNGKPFQRSFVQFIMSPICKFCQAVTKGDEQKYKKMFSSLELSLKYQQKDLTGKQLLNAALKKWLPLSYNLLDAIVDFMPSPSAAQQYRTKYLYEGPEDDAISKSMKVCDPKGPLMIYIVKMIQPLKIKNRLYAYGRVYSGTAYYGKKVRILGPNYRANHKDDVFIKTIFRTFLPTNSKIEYIPDVPCGNIVILSGIQRYLDRYGTIVDADYPQSYPIRYIKQKSGQS